LFKAENVIKFAFYDYLVVIDIKSKVIDRFTRLINALV